MSRLLNRSISLGALASRHSRSPHHHASTALSKPPSLLASIYTTTTTTARRRSRPSPNSSQRNLSSSASPPTMAPIPATMKAVSFAQTGGVDVLDHATPFPVPSISPTEILVRNHYAGVNFIDTYFRSGQYKPATLPLIPGQEAAGEIVQVGSAVPSSLHLAVGTRVVYMPGAGAGTYCEYTKVSAAHAIAIPDGVAPETAVAVFLQGLTAWTFVKRAAGTQRGDWALVHAAAGGVGSLLVQMLKIVGAKVIATASSAEKLKIATELGADYAVNSHEDVVAKVKEITGGHGVDSIFDGVGKATFEADQQMIAVGGNLVMLGNSSGNVEPFDIRATLGPKNIRLTRPIVGGYIADRASLEKYSNELFDLVKSGKVKVLTHATYDLNDAAQAHTDIASRKTIGKLLIKIN